MGAHGRNRSKISAVLAGALTVAGCATAPLTPAGPPPTVVQIAQERTEVGCLDVTSSVPPEFGEAAREWFARRIGEAVTGPMGPATFYLRLTTSASYSARADVRTVRLPALEPAPTPTAGPENPFEQARRDAVAAENGQTRAAWQQQLAEARRIAAAEADALRSAPLPTDDRATDVLGCVVKAAELLDAPGDRLLFVAGDLAPSGPQSVAPGDLRSAPVVVAVWCSDDAGTCVDRREQFLASLRDLGAGPVTMLDAQQIP